VPLLEQGSWVPIKHSVTGAEANLYGKFHLDPFNRLATIHQRYRQDRQDNGPIARSPKNCTLLWTNGWMDQDGT